ncbi:MAG: hypothetical protein K2O86_04515 [Clostridia bacterium]|nr:hypothetical protein [Clostridia bacterium]
MGDKNHNKEHSTDSKKESKQSASQKAKPSVTASNTVKSNRLKLLVTIVARKKAEYYTDLIQSFEVNMQMVILAEGTANAKMMSLLGLTDSDKAVILGVIQENKIPDALRTLEEKFHTIKDGKGVACTIPLTSVIGTLIYGFLSNNRMTVKESK